jgi:phosphohistidine swiveling domain-containing protein
MSSVEKVIDTFMGSKEFNVEWKDAIEKKLHWFYDDLHCPHPISPLYFDIGGWWGNTCEYMYRRFGAPFGKTWIAKNVNEYVYTTVVPRTDEQEMERLGTYYGQVMPVYAENFLKWWKERYLPEILTNLEYIDNYPYGAASIVDLLIHMEDALDIQERHFRIHWILNLAQFQAFMEFRGAYQEILGSIDEELIGKILVSEDDRNWDSLKALYNMKEYIKKNNAMSELFSSCTKEIMSKINTIEGNEEFLSMLAAYQKDFGNKAIYTHEYIYPTLRENPAPIYESLKNYLEIDYDFFEAFDKCKKEQKFSIEKLYCMVPDEAQKEKLRKTLELAVKMAPLTPDHHFYIDQGTYARMRAVFKEVGSALVKINTLEDCEDIFMLKYEEIRAIAVNSQAFDVKTLVKERRSALEDAQKIHPREWVGTISQWSLYEEPYKSLWGWPEKYLAEVEARTKSPKDNSKILKGLPASAGVAEGIARFVTSPAEFDQIQKGDILVCKMTNPAWVVSFTKIAGLVTDTGGALSHPAVVSREFGIPCVVGTSKATRTIKSGMRVRVDGSKGIVEILD